MKSSTRKWILLAVLSVIMIYVWWGNYQQFYGQQSIQLKAPGGGQQVQSTSAGSTTVEYASPKINPFRRFAAPGKPTTDNDRNRPIQPKQLPIPPLSAEYRLTGILTDENRPQAVIRGPEIPSRVVTVGDSLGHWEILQVKTNSIICGQGDRRDTLWYGEPDSH